MRRNFLIFVVVLSLLVISNPAHPQGSIGVMPMVIEIESSPGAREVFELTLFSTTPKRSATVRLSLFDPVQGLSGSFSYEKPGANAYSCSSWIELEKEEVTVPAGERVAVRGKIKIPRTERGTRAATIMLEPVTERKKGGVTIQVRYAVFVKLSIKGRYLPKKAEVAELSVLKDGRAPTIQCVVANLSDISFPVGVTATLSDSKGKIMARIPLYSEKASSKKEKNTTIYPGAKVAFKEKITKLIPPGEYSVQARLKYGKRGHTGAKEIFFVDAGDFSLDEVAAGELKYEIKPSSIEAKIPAGGSKYSVISITNQEEEDINFKLKVADYEGAKEDENSFSCAGWISLGSVEFTIKPRRTHRVPVNIKVPAGVAGGRYARILAEASLAGGESKNSSQIDVVLVMPGEENRLAVIKEFLCEPGAGKKQQLEVTLLNKGNIHLTPKGEVVINDIYNNVVEKVELKSEDKIIVPQCSCRMNGTVKRKLVPGEYTAVATVDYGGDGKATAKVRFIED